MRQMLLALLVVMLFASLGSAAIVYEPVQYQYGWNPHYYYGGQDPRVFAYGENLQCFWNARMGVREGRFGYGYLHRGLTGRADEVYTDCLPPGINGAIYGFSIADARNEANMNATRYFRKADLVATGRVDPDGTLVVSAQAQPVSRIEIKRYDSSTRPAPRPILIIPKRLLDKPLQPEKSVADAR